jgi:hypothetical protein
MDINKLFKIVIMAAILIVSLTIAYHYIVYIPQNEEAKRFQAEQARLEEVKKEEAEKKTMQFNLAACLSLANINYLGSWKENCKLEGKPDTCTSLLTYHAQIVEDAKQQEIDNCYKQYPQ